ncbi:SIR2 family protein [Tardiphaga sp. 37S4]|uniref:SIR2 family protein n=1 Tax=Tardiphaga sp. 37S4 TaxID=1404741 RepID=UPI001E3D53B2|nr:SIR2 family protein [Tardiphaga sp. 37S4]UFS75660.1 SIR2 family protein [Tardiphaga sp. 37S4]
MAASEVHEDKCDGSNLMDVHSKAVVHLRAQRQRQRLGLVFGSGVSKDLGFPDWRGLISRIAANPSVQAKSKIKDLIRQGVSNVASQATQSHIIFEHFRSRQLKKKRLTGSVPLLEEHRIKSDWLRIIHRELYKDVDASKRTEDIDKHPYLTAFTEIIKESPLTVNYNFDDTLEKLLINSRTKDEQLTTRGYEVADQPSAQFQNNSGVVYHPNGFIPSKFDDGTSAEVVFANDAFQDQLLSAAHGRYVHLSNHLFRNTCLLIGLSLDDATLQSMLRQNAVSNPGHIHYFVYFVQTDGLSKDARKTIFDANFSSYNLFTIFLDASGIRALAELIRMPVKEFDQKFPPEKRKYVYYVIGSIGAGKSTAASNFRNLITYDEWIDERLPELAKPQSEVDEEVVSDLDGWIATQFMKKNHALKDCREGIHIVDRCPLDPLTFPGDRQSKAQKLLQTITNNKSIPIEAGHVILLDCDFDELKLRNSLKHKYWSNRELKGLLEDIDEVYHRVEKTAVCTRGRDAAEVAREIAKVIFLADYEPANISEHLRHFAGEE